MVRNDQASKPTYESKSFKDKMRRSSPLRGIPTGVNTTKVEEGAALTAFLANLKDIQETVFLLLTGSFVDGNATTFRGVHVSWTLVGTKLFCDDVPPLSVCEPDSLSSQPIF